MAEENFTEVSFEELNLKDSIKRAVLEMGFEHMTPIQAQAIPVLMEGKDVIGQAQTGTGKTAAFGIPVLEKIDPAKKTLQAIILCPTRELAVQAAGELRAFAQYMEGVRLLPVYGGQDITRQISGLRGAQIVVGTPGRVMDHMRRHTIKMDDVSMVVLDEADEMLDMGFREDMEVILGAIEHEHQTCLFSATMPKAIMDLANSYQKDPEVIQITRKELTTNNITQYYYPIKWEYKNVALLRLLDYYQYRRSVIFCNTKSMVDSLAELLQQAGYVAEGLHGDLTQKQRDSVMGRFRNGRLSILIATDIAARGIDVDDVEAVFNYDVPQEAEYYVHRIGRTGRAGREGAAHTLCRSRDFRKIHEIEGITHAKMEERKIPSVDEISDIRKVAALDRVMHTFAEGKSGALVPVIRQYCEDNDVSIDNFAAAALRMILGDSKREGDDLDVDIQERANRGGRGGRGGRGERGDRGGRFGRGDRGDRGDRRYRRDREDRGEGRGEGRRGRSFGDGKRRERREDRPFGEDRRREHRDDRRGRSFGEEKKHFEEKKRKKNPGDNVLSKFVKDLRMNGEAAGKKKHK